MNPDKILQYSILNRMNFSMYEREICSQKATQNRKLITIHNLWMTWIINWKSVRSLWSVSVFQNMELRWPMAKCMCSSFLLCWMVTLQAVLIHLICDDKHTFQLKGQFPAMRNVYVLSSLRQYKVLWNSPNIVTFLNFFSSEI